jgi:hypothetical protein
LLFVILFQLVYLFTELVGVAYPTARPKQALTDLKRIIYQAAPSWPLFSIICVNIPDLYANGVGEGFGGAACMTENRLSDYLEHLQQSAADACSFVEGLNKNEFIADKRTQQAVIMNIIIIGEAATK